MLTLYASSVDRKQLTGEGVIASFPIGGAILGAQVRASTVVFDILADTDNDVFQLKLIGRQVGESLDEDVDWSDWVCAAPDILGPSQSLVHIFEVPLPERDLTLIENETSLAPKAMPASS